MKCLVLMVILFPVFSSCGRGETISEETVAAWIRRFSRREHSDSTFARGLLTSCGGESNRIVRAAKLLCDRNEGPRESRMSIRMIGEFGTTNDLAYLDRYVTDEFLGASVIFSCLRIGGLTTDTLERMRRYHSITNVVLDAFDHRSLRESALNGALYWARAMSPRTSVWTNLFDYSYNYISNNVKSVDNIDWWMLELRPEYRFTKRRLALMRWVLKNTEHPFYRAKTQEVIDEMEAYPEANLPE